VGSTYRIPGSPERSIEEHGLIVAAVSERKAEDARALMRKHLAGIEP
jgi:DNA-binding GntR family transcriptional regulator